MYRLLAFALILAGCTPDTPPPASAPAMTFADSFAVQLEQAHGVEAYRETALLAFDLSVDFPERLQLEADFVFETNGPRARMETADGQVVVFDGERAWLSPADGALGDFGFFHVLTWPWFVVSPFKARGPGTFLAPAPARELAGTRYAAARQTFGDGVGNDWYELLVDDQGRLRAQTYIVTWGKTPEQAEESPSAILYEDDVTVDGVVLSRHWRFFHWDKERQRAGAEKGTAQVGSYRFLPADDAPFAIPEGARELTLQGAR